VTPSAVSRARSSADQRMRARAARIWALVSAGGGGEAAADNGEKKFRGGLVVMSVYAYFISYETYHTVMQS
jgi:hypothetical protein